MQAAPFPAPPASMRSDDGYVHVVWRLGRGKEACSPASASVLRERYELSRVMPLLAAERRFEDARIRIEEAMAKGEAGPDIVRAYARALLWAFLHDPDRELRQVAALGLGVSGDPEAHEELRRMLQGEAAAASKALRALARIGNREDVDLVLGAVRRNDGVVSLEAAAASVQFGLGPKAVAALEPALRGEDPLARGRALRALCRINHPKALPQLQKAALAGEVDRPTRLAAVETIGRTQGDESARVLIRLAGDNNPAVRAQALLGLGRSGALRTRARLLASERLSDPAQAVRSAAAATYIRVTKDPSEWRMVVREVLRSGDVGSGLGAVESLEEVGGPEAMKQLEKLAEHQRPEVRDAAAAALGRRRGAAPAPGRSARTSCGRSWPPGTAGPWFGRCLDRRSRSRAWPARGWPRPAWTSPRPGRCCTG